LRRFLYLAHRGASHRAELTYVTTGIILICRSWKLASNSKSCYNSRFALREFSIFVRPVQLIHGHSATDVSPTVQCVGTLARPVYESFYLTSKEVYETSQNPSVRTVASSAINLDSSSPPPQSVGRRKYATSVRCVRRIFCVSRSTRRTD